MDKCEAMKAIADYDIVVDDPEIHVPYAMFCSTFDAYEFMAKVKVKHPQCSWKVMRLDEWQEQYKGED